MEEIFKDVKGFEGYYKISNTGRLKSLPREVLTKGNSTRFTSERFISGSINNKTLCVQLTNGLNIINTDIKNLVSFHFLEIPTKFPNKFYKCYYKDQSKIQDCSINNIEYRVNNSALRVYDYEGNFLSDYVTAKDAEMDLDIGSISTNISNSLNGGSLHCYGLQFRRLTDFTTIYKLPSLFGVERSDTVPVAKYFKERLICVYNSVSEAAYKNNIQPVDIGYVLDGKTKVNCFRYKRIL